MKHDNPAARLHSILVQGTKISPDTPCREAWADILGCDSVDTSVIFMRLGKVMQLTALAAEQVFQDFPGQSTTVPLWRDPVDAAFMHQNLADRWQTFIQHINPHCVAHLSLTADLIGHKFQTKLLDDTELQQFEFAISTLRDEILRSEADPIVKRYLDNELSVLLRTISEYRITGGGPILKEVEALFGHLVRDPEYRSFLVDHELGRRILDQLAAMANLVTVAVGLPQLTVVLTGLLPK